MRRSTLFCSLLLPVTLATACGAEKSDTGGAADGGEADGGDGDGDGDGGEDGEDGEDGGEDVDCGDSTPVIDSVTLENGGLADVDGTMVPSVLTTVTVTDADGDLTLISTTIYVDQTVDGVVDDSTSLYEPSTGEIDAAPCEANAVQLQLQLPIPAEAGLDYGAELEVGIVVADSKGNRSDMGIGAGCVPNEDGSDCAAR